MSNLRNVGWGPFRLLGERKRHRKSEEQARKLMNLADSVSYSRLEDDGSAQIIAVDLEEDQALWVRVGPVYHEPDRPDKNPGIWIEYQEKFMESSLSGSVLLSVETWRELCAAVEARIHK